MIVAVGENEGRTLLLLGLSKVNIERLMAHQPIRMTAESHHIPDGLEIQIVYGDTEGAIEQKLLAAGVIDSQTITKINAKLNS